MFFLYMKLGTKSVLYGCHQFLCHPFTVWLAWIKLYRKLPTWEETISIFCHDLAYWGCAEIDGPEGRQHPHGGAMLAARIVGRIKHWTGRGSGVCLGRNPFDVDTYFLTLLHSRHTAKARGIAVSKLCAADKCSVFFDPEWFYLLRARLSGELQEFMTRAIDKGNIMRDATGKQWLLYYKESVRNYMEKLL